MNVEATISTHDLYFSCVCFGGYPSPKRFEQGMIERKHDFKVNNTCCHIRLTGLEETRSVS